MLYRKVRISHLDEKKSLYRLLYVPENINLYDFALIIMRTFRMIEGHLFEFSKKKISYGLDDDYSDYDMHDYRLLDPGDTYRFIYDFGDYWEFEVRIYKKTVELDKDSAVVLEGKGQGIWEDDRWGYMHLLNGEMPGTLSEDDEDNSFYLPWNLDLKKAEDTFDEIDPDKETEYISAIRISEDLRKTGIWDDFHSAYDEACMSELKGEESISLWLNAYEEFQKNCTQLKEEGSLPKKCSEIQEEYPDFEGIGFIDDLISSLSENKDYEKLMQVTDELEQLFDPDEEKDIIRGRADALHGLGNNAEMLRYVQDKYAKDPQSDTLRMLMLNAFRYNRKKKDGRLFMENILKTEQECNESNYQFYNAALEFARYAGLKIIEKKLAKAIEEEDLRIMKEIEETLGSSYDDNDVDDQDLDVFNISQKLRQSVLTYKEKQNEYSYQQMLKYFGMLMLDSGMLYVAGSTAENSESGEITMQLVQNEQGIFLPLFTTDPKNILPYIRVSSLPADIIAQIVLDKKFTGVILDQLTEDEHPAVIYDDTIRHLWNFCETI